MLIITGIAASVMMQVMITMQNQALQTGQDTIRDISSGLRVTQVSGYANNTKITHLGFFISCSAGSEAIDISASTLSLSNTDVQSILNYDEECYSSSVSNGLFNTLNSSNLTSSTFGLIVVRDADNSCKANSPNINGNDLIVLIINTTKCFSGIDTRTKVTGKIIPEKGISGLIGFTTPNVFVDTIIELL
jgi:flagellin FlaB